MPTAQEIDGIFLNTSDYAIANELMNQREFKKAEALFRKIANKDTKDWRILHDFSELLMIREKYKDPKEAAECALKLNPPEAARQRLLVRLEQIKSNKAK